MKFRKHKPDPESVRALADARQNLKKIKSRNQEVGEISTLLKIMRERNHFAERLEHIIGGHP